MVPRVAAKITVSKRMLVSLDTVDVLFRCARTMYQAVGAATKPMIITKPNGGMPMSTLIPMNASAMIPTTTAVNLNVFAKSHNQSIITRIRLINLEIFIDSQYVYEIDRNVTIHPRFVQFLKDKKQ